MKPHTAPPASSQPAPSLSDLERREQQMASRELELALQDAVLRGREATLLAGREGLERRARWIDAQVASLASWARSNGFEAADILRGLGDGAALREADIEGHVRRSNTLLLGRAAMLAAREEMLARRQRQISQRASEIADLEQASVRAEVRLTARERLVLAAARELEQRVGAPPPEGDVRLGS